MRVRSGTHLALGGVMVVAITGLLVVLGFADQAGTSRWLALPLLILACVAIPASGAELATARREEFLLARLRGIRGVNLLLLLAFEPLVTLTVAACLGLALGAIATPLVTRDWLDETSSLSPASAILWVSGVLLVALVSVLLGMAKSLHEPLPEQIGPSVRPRPIGALATFGQLLVLVAAAVAVYRSRAAASPDWVALSGPALVGLAAGQMTVWLIRAIAKAGIATGQQKRLATFLTVRRLARTDDVGGPLRLMVSAAVVALVAVTGMTSVNHWVDETGRINAGAPLVLPVNGDAEQTLAATHAADPEGRWLMAAVRVFSDDRGVSRQVFIDSARYSAVVGDFFSGTAADDGSDAIRELAEATAGAVPAPRSTGDDWSVTVRVGDFDRPADVVLTAEYVGSDGPTSETIRLLIPQHSARTGSVKLDACTKGCRVGRLTIAEGRPCTQVAQDLNLCGRPELTLTKADFGGVNLISQTWQLLQRDDDRAPGKLEVLPDALVVRPSIVGQTSLVPDETAWALPVLATDNLPWEDQPVINTPGGDQRPASVLGEYATLPVVASAGTVTDLPRALEDSSPTVPAAESLVLARADTPQTVLAEIEADGGSGPLTPGEIAAPIAERARVAQARAYELMAMCCLLLGALALAVPVSRQRRNRRTHIASLRLMLVPTTVLRRATRLELGLLATAGGLMTVIAGLIGVVLLLSRLPLISIPVNQIPLDTTPSPWPILAIAAYVGLTVLLVGGVVRRTAPAACAPATLREEAR